MLIFICSFTENGKKTADRIRENVNNHLFIIKGDDRDTGEFIRDAFEHRAALIFVGAMGITVRMIAPFVNDKLTDSPVIVVDELGQHVIPVLSGHMGGANELAKNIAVAIGAAAVITTATDINGVFAIDSFAKDNGFKIVNREGIVRVSSKLLKGEQAFVFIDEEEEVIDRLSDVLVKLPNEIIITANPVKADICLKVKKTVLGIGCKKGTDYDRLFEFVKDNVDDLSDIYGIASIDLKAMEYAIVALSTKLGIPFVTYSADELNLIEGSFSSSAFVKDKTGTDNVCERSAMALAGIHGELISAKKACDGMTLAVASRF